MKRKMVLGAILTVLLVLQAQTVFADAIIRVACLANPNRSNNILGRVSVDGNYFRELVGHEYSSGYARFEELRNGPYLVTVKSFRWSWGEWREAFSETLRVEAYNDYTNITCSFDNNGRILNLRISERRDLVGEFIFEYMGKRDGAGLSAYFQRNNLDLDEYINYRFSGGNTYLIDEIKKSRVNLGNVQFLVENGARINMRNDLGETAASVAYDKGEIEVYDYLKIHGAIDFEPRQAANQPAAPAQSTTNVYVQPSAPVQPAPAPATPAVPRLSPGFYSDRSVSGSQINLTMVYSNATNATGTAFHSINRANNSQGNLTISDNQMVINWYSGPLSGVRTVYRIDSSNQFSGPGEVWRM